jgi:hypothetical protein
MTALTNNQQIQAGKLYTSGLSVQQIADFYSISIDAAFYALRKQKIARRSSAESNKLRFESQDLSYKIKTELTHREEDLKLAALMLYWAEGYKVGKSTVDFANSDPEMVTIFIRFLRDICGIKESKIRCHIYCYEGQNIQEIKAFWSNLLHVPETQFTKPYIKKANPSVRGPRMIHGLVHVLYCDTKLLKQILEWIGEYSKKCVDGGVVNRKGL